MTVAPDHVPTHDDDHDVLDVLVTDHREAAGLIAQIRAASAPQERRDLADTLISELVRHAVAEETYLYPTMKAHLPDADEAVEHDVEEHKELDVIMKELEGVDAGAPEFVMVLDRLDAVLDDHLHDEEDDQFPVIREHVPAEVLVDLKDKVQAFKRIAPTRPHPNAPHTQLFHLLVGPGVGLVDRARDALTGRKA
jgi:iron-sulfur cluster repair protein YtfE (RIC family)